MALGVAIPGEEADRGGEHDGTLTQTSLNQHTRLHLVLYGDVRWNAIPRSGRIPTLTS